MAGEGGRAYEQDLYTKMNQAGVVPEGFTPAGSDSSAPDIIFFANRGERYHLELKNSSKLLDFGQSVIHHNGTSWEFKGTNPVMVEMLTELGVMNVVTTNWTEVPHKRTRQSVTKPEAIQDIINFPDITASADVDNVIRYYNNKMWRGRGTFYIQIENLGLYYMGSNPANIPGIPELSGSFEVRVRRKPSGSTREDPDLTAALLGTGRKAKLPSPLRSYGFTTAFVCTSLPAASPINLDDIENWL